MAFNRKGCGKSNYEPDWFIWRLFKSNISPISIQFRSLLHILVVSTHLQMVVGNSNLQPQTSISNICSIGTNQFMSNNFFPCMEHFRWNRKISLSIFHFIFIGQHLVVRFLVRFLSISVPDEEPKDESGSVQEFFMNSETCTFVENASTFQCLEGHFQGQEHLLGSGACFRGFCAAEIVFREGNVSFLF